MSDLVKEQGASRSDDCPPCPGKPVLERIDARQAEIGKGFIVRRAVPSKARRMVGAWCFLDHAGPVAHGPGEGLKVGPHPHIGLQTFTWMIEGEGLHRDSLGYEQIIRPGQVNLMTAGRGIAHSEESPHDGAGRLHAAQLWIALPDSERHREPAFHHYPDLPVIERGGFTVTLLAGEALGQTAPAQVFSPLVGLDLTSRGAASTRLPLEPGFEHAVMCLRGSARVEGEVVEPGMLLYLGQGRDTVEIGCDGEAQLLLVGGEPFAEDILVWWNFVARTPEEIRTATENWNAGRGFGEVKGTPLAPLKAPSLAGLSIKG
ncbi:MAG: pirin family protein [Alcanivorax sp.]|nr:pirin family protein [Alcanivorax sp.]